MGQPAIDSVIGVPSGRPDGRWRLASQARSLSLEVAIVIASYEGYELSRALDPDRPQAALAHAQSLDGLEQRIHLNVEGSLNRALAHHDTLALAADYYYAILHLTIPIVTLVWLYFRRPSIYLRWRRALVVASAAALAIFWAFPVAPPRLSVPGMTDLMVTHNVFGVAHAANSGGFVNVYAALPSLHVGWAVWVALAVSDGLRGHRWRHLVWVYPLLTTLVVIGTANHFALDAIAGAGLVVAAALVVDRASR